MNTPAIALHGVTKCFRRYARRIEALGALFGRAPTSTPQNPDPHDFWALKGIDLEIPRGQTWGIVGHNGSGKSTLLQIIAGTLNPTAGSVRVHGRIAALLELGSGFHPEFTGRENVFFQGQIQGCDRKFIEKKFDDILNFAAIGDFLDQPVKTYSSGMLVRLAFAVTIALDPEILIVDEALAVGDEAFQRKCFARIRSLRETGCTVLFVSHIGSQVVELCDRAILLEAGERLLVGSPKQVVPQYHRLLFAPPEKVGETRDEIRAGNSADPDLPPAPVPADAEFDPNMKPQSTIAYPALGAAIHEPRMERLDGTPANLLVHGEEYRYSYSVRFDRAATRVRFAMLIKTLGGFHIGGGFSHPLSRPLPEVLSGETLRVAFQFRCMLQPGVYFVNSGVLADGGDSEVFLHRVVDALMFRVQPTPDSLATAVVDFDVKPTITTLPAPAQGKGSAA